MASEQNGLGNSAAESLILLGPSKTKMVSCSAMRSTFLVDGTSVSKSFEPSHSHTIKSDTGDESWFGGTREGKIPSLQSKSPLLS